MPKAAITPGENKVSAALLRLNWNGITATAFEEPWHASRQRSTRP